MGHLPARRLPPIPAASDHRGRPARHQQRRNRGGQAAVAYALAQLGDPYVWGAAGPDAFDCSGLVYAAYRSAGITLPRTAGDQWHATQPVQPSQETTGDLIFTRISGNDAGHMMMVVSAGGGVIHAGEAPHTGDVVKLIDVPEAGAVLGRVAV